MARLPLNVNLNVSPVATQPTSTMPIISETERGLVPNTRYTIRVRAQNNLGIVSQWSEAIEIETSNDGSRPAEPENLELYTVDGHLTILWDDVTTNTDGTPITDLAYYEIFLDDGVLEPFRYTTISNSYTFLYSANKAIHDAETPPQPPAENWVVHVYAVDYSGNRSPAATNALAIDTSASGSDTPLNIQSNNYNGTTVEANDATTGYRLQENGKVEFEDIRANGNVHVKGHNLLRPPIAIYTRNEANTLEGRIPFEHTNWDAINFNDQALNNSIGGTSLTLYSGGVHTVRADGWYRLGLSHRWVVNGVGARHAHVQINSGDPRSLGGHNSGGGLATELNHFYDSRCFNLSYGDELIFRLMQDSGGELDLIYAQLVIEWLSL